MFSSPRGVRNRRFDERHPCGRQAYAAAVIGMPLNQPFFIGESGRTLRTLARNAVAHAERDRIQMVVVPALVQREQEGELLRLSFSKLIEQGHRR